MIPIIVDAKQSRIAVVGEGSRALGRVRLLVRHGCEPKAVFAPNPSAELAEAASDMGLVRQWPTQDDFAAFDVVFGADLERSHAEELAQFARNAKALFNAEDITELCTFQMPATLRRGALLISVSTDGTAPALSRQLAARLSLQFGPEWEAHVQELGEARRVWRNSGLDGAAIAKKTEAMIALKGWLP